MSTRLIVAAALSLAGVLMLATGAEAAPGCDSRGAAGIAYETGVNCRTVEVDGHPRRYVVYVPALRLPAAPVVLMFHGSSGTGEQFLRSSGWREEADRTGLIAVFPTGLRYRVIESGRRVTKWNEFGLADKVTDERPPGYPLNAPMPADDVGFVDRIMADLDSRLPIDERRVYASGFSNGANFAARLSVDRSTRIAAAGYSGGGLDGAHQADRPVPTYITAGSQDAKILEGTGLPELPLDPLDILGTPPTGPFLDGHLATLGLDPGDFGAVTGPRSTLIRWPAPDPRLQFRMMRGLGHVYPDGAARDFWEFFRAHRLP
jgi:polyhydroxybutyrate depolymerase